MEVCEAGGDPSPCLARETAAAAAAAASTPSVADPHQQQQHHQKQQQQQQGQQRDFQAMKPLSFDEAERKKEKKKTQEYRQYLVQTRVIQTLVNLLLEIKERDPLPEDPQQVLIDYFGEYRDPVLDVIDELTEKKDKLTAENTNMTEELESLGNTTSSSSNSSNNNSSSSSSNNSSSSSSNNSSGSSSSSSAFVRVLSIAVQAALRSIINNGSLFLSASVRSEEAKGASKEYLFY
ncbi:hypothetical protein ACSSS7_007983 [Eimeria intestinalis]